MSNSLLVHKQFGAIEAAAEQLLASQDNANTHDAYTLDWARWQLFASQNSLDMAQPSLPDAINYREELKRTSGPATVQRRLATLSFFYRAFMAAGLCRVNPFDRAWLKRDPAPQGVTKVLDQGSVNRLFAYLSEVYTPNGLRDLALLRIMYDTGARRASVGTALRAGIDWQNNALRIIIKGGKSKLLNLTEDCMEALKQWLRVAPDSDFIFCSARQKKGYDKHQGLALSDINRILKMRAKEAGIEHIHPHQFRATFITDGFSAGISARDMQLAAHHADPSMTARYDRGVRGEQVPSQVTTFRKDRK